MNYPLFARLHEFLITQPKTIDLAIADKLYQFHIIPMQAVREALGVWLSASLKSGYRPKWWERKKKRSGNSQHCFEDEWADGSGAVDWTCGSFKANKNRLLELMIKHTNYTRLAVYDGFIHADYKSTPSGKREVYHSDANSNWTKVREL